MKKFDLHIHSTCSKHKVWGIDGINTPQEIVDRAVHIGLDGIALTDHNTVKGGQKAIQYIKENDIPLLVIPGSEIRSKMGDIIALGINENIQPKLSILETIDAIKEQNGLAIAAHPFKYNSKLGLQLKNPSINSQFDAIEVFNSNLRKKANYRALKIAESFNIPGIAGSDAHYKMNVGIGITCLNIENLSIDDVLEAIKTNKIKLSCKNTPIHNIFSLYFRKMGNLFKRTIGKGNTTCKK